MLSKELAAAKAIIAANALEKAATALHVNSLEKLITELNVVNRGWELSSRCGHTVGPFRAFDGPPVGPRDTAAVFPTMPGHI